MKSLEDAATLFQGRWFTTFGALELDRSGTRIQGTYRVAGGEGHLSGSLRGTSLHFRYRDPAERGTGTFRLARSGRFEGSYRPDDATLPRRWDGHRGWDGIWESNHGRLHLRQQGRSVTGTYAGPGACVLTGRDRGGILAFRYRERDSAGEGRFRLLDGGERFEGEWRSGSRDKWKPWSGHRAHAAPAIEWLVVFEAHWQRALAEPEYSYGGMLREFFARSPSVRMRHRFFHDAPSLEHWCRELAFLPEPVVLLLASHGLEGGLSVHGRLIDTGRVLESLADVESLRLVHFSSCLVARDAARAMRSRRWPVSGYTTRVDWGASALLEFTYLDLLLNRGIAPDAAARKLRALVPYAGARAPAGVPYRAAGFRFFPARR